MREFPNCTANTCSATWPLHGVANRGPTAGCFTPTLLTGEIKEFLLPQFANGKLPNGLTVHGFGQDGSGELYALVTNTPG